MDLDQFLKTDGAEKPQAHFEIGDEEEAVKLEEVKEIEKVTTHFQKSIGKGKSLETHEIEQLELDMVLTRKMAKNGSLVSNFISSYEDRFLSIVEMGAANPCLVVFKKCVKQPLQ